MNLWRGKCIGYGFERTGVLGVGKFKPGKSRYVVHKKIQGVKYMKYQVVTSDGNICFDGQLFDSTEEAWEHVFESHRKDVKIRNDEYVILSKYDLVEVD